VGKAGICAQEVETVSSVRGWSVRHPPNFFAGPNGFARLSWRVTDAVWGDPLLRFSEVLRESIIVTLVRVHPTLAHDTLSHTPKGRLSPVMALVVMATLIFSSPMTATVQARIPESQ